MYKLIDRFNRYPSVLKMKTWTGPLSVARKLAKKYPLTSIVRA
jgi:hypothetical protein